MSQTLESPVCVDAEIAIIGYGPVGAFTALLLAEAGLSVLILDREAEILQLPRAVGLDGESIRAFQRFGIGEAVNAILQPPREVDRLSFTDSKHNELFGTTMAPRGVNGWRDLGFFDQPELEAVLREQVEKHPRITTMLGVEFEHLEQSEAAVTLDGHTVGSNEAWSLTALFAIGCDGAASRVRRELGIEWVSLGYDQDWLVIDVIQKPEANLPLLTMQVCDPARLTSYICVKDPNRRWEFQLQDGESREEMTDPANIEALLDPWLPPEHYDIRRAAVYQFHAATAQSWREGRILLAGDAAHQTPPFLGQGLNAGLRDAVNLGWKLPLVLSGASDAAMLDSYEEERAPHSLDLVEGAVRIGMLMETFAAREGGQPDPHAAAPPPKRNFSEGRMAPPLRAGILAASQLEGGYATGELLEQPTVRTPAGETLRFDDLLGTGFAIVGRDESALRVEGDGQAVLRALDIQSLPIHDLDVVEGRFDPLFKKHSAVVLRPDRYIYGVVDDASSLDDLLVDLARKLELRPAQ